MNAKPNLILLGNGQWVNPAYVTSVVDCRVNGTGNVTIHTVGSCVYFNTTGYDDRYNNQLIADAFKAIGISPTETKGN